MDQRRKRLTGKNSRIWCLIGAFCLALTGCGAGSGDQQQKTEYDSGRLQVVTTIFPAYDFARQIGGEMAQVQMLLSPGEELHSYEPSPKDIIAIEECDVFIYVGGESDTWVEGILESIDTSEMSVIAMMDVVEALTEVTVEGMDTGGIFGGHDHSADAHGHEAGEECTEEHAHEDGEICAEEHIHENSEHGKGEHAHVEYDEHVWTSPENARLIVERIADEFVRSDPENEALYRFNEAGYLTELDKLAKGLRSVREAAVWDTIIVGDRFPYRYLAEFMELDYYAAFPGCAEETEPSAKTVAFLIDKVKEEQIPAVFHGEFSSHLLAETICEETGAQPLLLHSCHNVTKAELESGVTYLDLMWENANNLRVALCQ